MVEQFGTMYRRQLPYFRPGDSVRITRGALADLTGVFVRTAGHLNCVITIDGIANGVRVVLPMTSLSY